MESLKANPGKSNASLSVHLEEQKKKVILTARDCFAERGLHGTSVSYIASSSGLGQGQLYRIFSSKNQIIEAVVNDIVAERVKDMISDNKHLERKAESLTAKKSEEDELKERKGDCLLMEINAESSRNPQLKIILQKADQILKIQGDKTFREVHPEMKEEDGRVLAEFIAVLSEGVAYRRNFRIEDSENERLEMKQLYNEFFSYFITNRRAQNK